MYHTLNLAEGQDIICIALNQDNTNLLVSTADEQLIIFTDPSVSCMLFCLSLFENSGLVFSYEISLSIARFPNSCLFLAVELESCGSDAQTGLGR